MYFADSVLAMQLLLTFIFCQCFGWPLHSYFLAEHRGHNKPKQTNKKDTERKKLSLVSLVQCDQFTIISKKKYFFPNEVDFPVLFMYFQVELFR